MSNRHLLMPFRRVAPATQTVDDALRLVGVRCSAPDLGGVERCRDGVDHDAINHDAINRGDVDCAESTMAKAVKLSAVV